MLEGKCSIIYWPQYAHQPFRCAYSQHGEDWPGYANKKLLARKIRDCAHLIGDPYSKSTSGSIYKMAILVYLQQSIT